MRASDRDLAFPTFTSDARSGDSHWLPTSLDLLSHECVERVEFRYAHHLVVIPAVVGGVEAEMVLDTGIGVSLLTEELAGAVRCERTGGVHVGRRMSGQHVSVPLATLDSLSVAGSTAEGLTVGVLDLGAIPGLEGVGGFLSLAYFRKLPVTFEYSAHSIVLEDEASLAARSGASAAVDVQIRTDADATTVFLPLAVDGVGHVLAEVDTGSDSLILDERFAVGAGIDLEAPTTRSVEGSDETGHRFVRHFATLAGAVRLESAPNFSQPSPEVMFQDIIHDGLVGDAFLRNFNVTYDLERSRMLFSEP